MKSVRNCYLTPLLLFMIVLSVSGCSGEQDNRVEQNSRANLKEDVAVESAAETASDSNQNSASDAASILAEVDATDPHRKTAAVAEKPVEEFVVCSMCGKQVPKRMAVFLDGELVCAHCVPGAHASDIDTTASRDQAQTP
jgi:formylmethanofuran dehydrogenase subunit E